MNSEMSYLLEELTNWDQDKPIQVKDLKRMIEKSHLKAEQDQQLIDDSMTPDMYGN